MNLRWKVLVVAGGVFLMILSFAYSQNVYRLKESDQKKLCLSCHADFEEKLKKQFVHTAVVAGECSSCHNPHVSSHGKMLSDDTSRICLTCHEGIVPEKAKSVHKVVADGECVKCHDPHAADNASNLLGKGNELCFTCHTALGESVKQVKFKHNPVEQGCLTCHGPHGSADASHLLKSDVPALCVNCHKADNPSFVARHMNYPVGKAACTSCHNPHGSNQPALLLDNVHPPVSNRMCNQCHEAPDSPAPFATKRPGFELCKGCHNDMVNTTLAKRRIHWPLADKQGCLNCHSPHASKQEKLLKTDTVGLCRSCHSDTMNRFETTAVKHSPVKEGMCVTCHSPHGAQGTYLVDQPSMIDLCGTCHDYQQHSSHPIGEKAVDPRNKNLTVQCLSCHKGHGTEFKWMLLAETNLELCTRCHKEYSR